MGYKGANGLIGGDDEEGNSAMEDDWGTQAKQNIKVPCFNKTPFPPLPCNLDLPPRRRTPSHGGLTFLAGRNRGRGRR